MTIKAGDKLPDATFKIMTADGPAEKTTAELFSGKTVVLFAVPGAFTPTCHNNHLPGFVEHFDTIRAKGVDEIAVVSVNDVFVMDAWAKASGNAGKIHFLADGSAEFTKAIGLELDASGFGMGVRSKRYSMIVKDGVVETLNVEEAPGTAEASGAAEILNQLS
jgi:peroxiredoxin